MAFSVNGANLGTALKKLLCADDIEPGSEAGYQTCKAIFLFHTMGQKIVDFPLMMAQYKPRKITVPMAPGDGVKMIEAFEEEWRAMQADRYILNHGRLSSIYGIATLGIIEKDADTKTPLDFQKLDSATISFSVFDPLNTAGSLVLNQDPNALDFQKTAGVEVGGTPYHRSRVCVLQNEDPVYLAYEGSGYGFTGRSVYQRALYPLKSFITTMVTDDMIALKAGVLIAKLKSQSSAVDGPMAFLNGKKRQMVKEARVGNVLSIDIEEAIESLNMQNLEGPYALARNNIIDNMATGSGRPAKILRSETFTQGFGEGTEDAKAIAMFIDFMRSWLRPSYDFMDQICMYRAWNREFFERMQTLYPEEYGEKTYEVVFQELRNSFRADWPNLLEEPDSEKAKSEKVALEAIISVIEVLMPELPPMVKAKALKWMVENLNARRHLFTSPMEMDDEDYAEIEAYEPPKPETSFGEPKPESFADAQRKERKAKRETLDDVDTVVRRDAIKALRLVTGNASGHGGAV